MPPQWIIPEGSLYSRGPSLRMYSLAALILDGRERSVRQAGKAFPASSESLDWCFVYILGPLSRAGIARGPHLEHVIRTRPPCTAVQEARPCSKSRTCNTHFFCCDYARGTPGDPPVHFGGYPSPFGFIRSGRTSGLSSLHPRRGKGVLNRITPFSL